MSPDEMKHGLLIDELTDLSNKRAYTETWDEYYSQFDSPEQADAVMKSVAKRLENAIIPVDEKGERKRYKGGGLAMESEEMLKAQMRLSELQKKYGDEPVNGQAEGLSLLDWLKLLKESGWAKPGAKLSVTFPPEKQPHLKTTPRHLKLVKK